jgi:hypothetical protein
MLQPYVHRSRATPASMFIIRISLVFGVVMFGGLTWYLHSQRTEPFPTDNETVTWVVLGAWTVITIGIVYLSGRYRAAASRDQRITLAIIGWALGEAAALLGGVHYFVTGSPQRYGYGFLIFVIALVLFPIPRDEEGPRLVR